MDQKVELSNADYLALNKRIQNNEKCVEELRNDLQGSDAVISKIQEELEEVKHNRVLNEDTLSLMMENAVRNGLSEVMKELKVQEERIRSLEVDKYKMAYRLIGWVAGVAGAVVVTYIVTRFLHGL
ncbi:hypothetical protein [Listeria fleischmannii]|uniref:Uncharacterized protein n=1 Tax=Listeria fleischmannii FSL S10-1203 TaxID=1265822 RepID=W7CWW9_9LIST|nr:hypothetical protein [Listeria fleischmannii]EUJ44024.1 hypothetical protein MCOL2_20056 [Listeria fleischmannii FSL S10-1203]